MCVYIYIYTHTLGGLPGAWANQPSTRDAVSENLGKSNPPKTISTKSPTSERVPREHSAHITIIIIITIITSITIVVIIIIIIMITIIIMFITITIIIIIIIVIIITITIIITVSFQNSKFVFAA